MLLLASVERQTLENCGFLLEFNLCFEWDSEDIEFPEIVIFKSLYYMELPSNKLNFALVECWSEISASWIEIDTSSITIS